MKMKLSAAKKTLVALGLFSLSSLSFAGDFADAFEAASAEEYNKAAKIWYTLAQEGNPDAQFNLALVYHSGAAGELNEKEAVKWYQKAASNGQVRAQEYLAVAYREGWFGLEKDISKAEYWEAKLEL
jgi:TPR repeat protein